MEDADVGSPSTQDGGYHDQPRSADQDSWTPEYCLSLLNPLQSALAALRRSEGNPVKKDLTAQTSGKIPSRKSSRSEASERYETRGARKRRKIQPLPEQFDDSYDLVRFTPGIETILKITLCALDRSNNIEGQQCGRTWRDSPPPLQFFVTKLKKGESAVLRAFVQILEATGPSKYASPTGPTSLFKLCEERLPMVLERSPTQGEEHGQADESSAKMITYGELANLFSIHQNSSWKDFPDIVREHCVFIINQAVEDRLFGIRMVHELLLACGTARTIHVMHGILCGIFEYTFFSAESAIPPTDLKLDDLSAARAMSVYLRDLIFVVLERHDPDTLDEWFNVDKMADLENMRCFFRTTTSCFKDWYRSCGTDDWHPRAQLFLNRRLEDTPTFWDRLPLSIRWIPRYIREFETMSMFHGHDSGVTLSLDDHANQLPTFLEEGMLSLPSGAVYRIVHEYFDIQDDHNARYQLPIKEFLNWSTTTLCLVAERKLEWFTSPEGSMPGAIQLASALTRAAGPGLNSDYPCWHKDLEGAIKSLGLAYVDELMLELLDWNSGIVPGAWNWLLEEIGIACLENPFLHRVLLHAGGL